MCLRIILWPLLITFKKYLKSIQKSIRMFMILKGKKHFLLSNACRGTLWERERGLLYKCITFRGHTPYEYKRYVVWEMCYRS